MIRLFSVEFWMAVLFFINFSLGLFIFVFIRRVNRFIVEQASQNPDEEDSDRDDPVRNTASDIMDMLEPLVKESRDAAILFEEQIKDKKRLLKGLNDSLDSRIININLLLSRAETMQKKLEERQAESDRIFASLSREEVSDRASGNVSGNVTNQQSRIIKMYHQKYDIDTIAQELSIPRGEVQLVIDLKKKFLEMEKNSR